MNYFDVLHDIPIDQKVTITTVTALAKEITRELGKDIDVVELIEPQTIGDYVAYAIDAICWAHSPDDEALGYWKAHARQVAIRDASNWL
jgi:hypothetical protein